MTLKTCIFLSALFSSAIGFAEVNDTDPVSQLPKNTPLTAQIEITVKPNTHSIYFQYGKVLYNKKNIVGISPYCLLDFPAVSDERVIRVGRKFELTLDPKLANHSYEKRQFTGFETGKGTFYCANAEYFLEPLSVGLMKDALKGIFEIGPFPTPSDF